MKVVVAFASKCNPLIANKQLPDTVRKEVEHKHARR